METKVMNCIMCPMGCEMTVTLESGKFVSVTGNTCPRGAKYAETEVTDPRRMLTTTVRIRGGLLPLLPVVLWLAAHMGICFIRIILIKQTIKSLLQEKEVQVGLKLEI